jgi:hypothetical protein
VRSELFWEIMQRIVVPSSRVKKSKMGATGYPETSVQYYHYTLRNFPEECISQFEGNFVYMGHNL